MKQKKISTNQQFKNALRWLNNLQHTKRLKGVGQLMIHKDKFSELIHDQVKHEYCCLGVGCKLFNVKKVDWENDTHNREFDKLVGIDSYKAGTYTKIFDINDTEFKNDRNFKNVRKALIARADGIFTDEVAKKIKKYFKVK